MTHMHVAKLLANRDEALFIIALYADKEEEFYKVYTAFRSVMHIKDKVAKEGDYLAEKGYKDFKRDIEIVAAFMENLDACCCASDSTHYMHQQLINIQSEIGMIGS